MPTKLPCKNKETRGGEVALETALPHSLAEYVESPMFGAWLYVTAQGSQ
jgi:hypothetical protein